MKYALIIPDGAADEPQALLAGKTPLQAARLPNMDAIAAAGLVGRADNTPPQLPSGSDVATMNLFGYDPLVYHTGRAPIEAAALGIVLGPRDWAVRCNLVSIHDERMKSFTAGQIPSDVAAACIAEMQRAIGQPGIELHAGVSYRNLMILRGDMFDVPFGPETKTTPPHDVTDKPIADFLPRGPGSDLLRNWMQASVDVLKQTPANASREDSAATHIWLWGQGQRPALTDFKTRFGITAAMTTSVDLLRGLAALLGWTNLDVPGCTGYLDNDYAGQAAAAAKALETVDLVVVHVEACDEVSHEGNAAAKVAVLERIDAEIVGPLHERLKAMGDYRILISPDHPTFVRTKTHSYGSVPFAMCGAGVKSDSATEYHEVSAASSSLAFERGCELMPFFLG